MYQDICYEEVEEKRERERKRKRERKRDRMEIYRKGIDEKEKRKGK